MSKKVKSNCYVYMDGRYLKSSYMGDGEYELYLVKELDKDCIFDNNWTLSEILYRCDGIYDENGTYLGDGNNFNETQFTKK